MPSFWSALSPEHATQVREIYLKVCLLRAMEKMEEGEGPFEICFAAISLIDSEMKYLLDTFRRGTHENLLRELFELRAKILVDEQHQDTAKEAYSSRTSSS